MCVCAHTAQSRLAAQAALMRRLYPGVTSLIRYICMRVCVLQNSDVFRWRFVNVQAEEEGGCVVVGEKRKEEEECGVKFKRKLNGNNIPLKYIQRSTVRGAGSHLLFGKTRTRFSIRFDLHPTRFQN